MRLAWPVFFEGSKMGFGSIALVNLEAVFGINFPEPRHQVIAMNLCNDRGDHNGFYFLVAPHHCSRRYSRMTTQMRADSISVYPRLDLRKPASLVAKI